MNYEQKYKNALERARDLMTNQNPPAFDKHLIEMVFPELKESEDKDEMIRQCLIEHIKCNKDLNLSLFQWFKPDTIIAWLEEQGKKKPIFNADDWYVSKVDGKIHNTKFIEKQGGEKPTDKVEPKFKVGDKVTIKGDNTVYTIDIIAPDKTCWLKHGSREYGWAGFGVLKHYVE